MKTKTKGDSSGGIEQAKRGAADGFAYLVLHSGPGSDDSRYSLGRRRRDGGLDPVTVIARPAAQVAIPRGSQAGIRCIQVSFAFTSFFANRCG